MLKQYLRYYVNYQHNNWVQLLSIGQLAYNSITTKIISVLLFLTNYGYHLIITWESQEFAKITQKALIKIEQIWILYNELQKNN